MTKARRGSTLVLALLAGVLLSGGTARAAGFGVWVDYSYADGRIDFEDVLDRDGDSVDETDYGTNRIGVGVLLDTNVSKDRLFNYRLQLGYQHAFREYEQRVGGGKIESDGFTMNHAFGFGLVRDRDFRLWGGAALRFSVDVIGQYGPAKFTEEPGVFSTDRVEDGVDIDAGIGPVVGLNWRMGPVVSGSLTVSYQYMYVDEFIGFGTHEGREHLVTVGLSLLLRSPSDEYRDR